MDITPFFKMMVDKGASDLYFTVGAAPNIKIEGATHPVGETILKSEQMTEIAYSVMNDKQVKEFEAKYGSNDMTKAWYKWCTSYDYRKKEWEWRQALANANKELYDKV